MSHYRSCNVLFNGEWIRYLKNINLWWIIKGVVGNWWLDILQGLNTLSRDRWTPSHRWHFQMHFHEWKYVNFERDHQVWPLPWHWPSIFKISMKLAISQLKMVWLPWNEKQTYQLKCRPQMGLWPWKWRCEDLKTVTGVTSDVGVPSTGLVILYNQVLASILAADSTYCTICILLKGFHLK